MSKTRVSDMTFKDVIDCLTSAEKYLRNRRMFQEADAVNYAKWVMLEDASEMITKMEDDGK